MTNQAFRSAPALSLPPDAAGDTGAGWGEVADLVRHFCADQGRHGFRLGGRERSGHLFIDRGHVVHAEYGEEFGLSAILQLLRAGPMRLERWVGAWPLHGSIHLSPERLLAPRDREEAQPVETRVVRKVTVPAQPPAPPGPLLQPQGAVAQVPSPRLPPQGLTRQLSALLGKAGRR